MAERFDPDEFEERSERVLAGLEWPVPPLLRGDGRTLRFAVKDGPPVRAKNDLWRDFIACADGNAAVRQRRIRAIAAAWGPLSVCAKHAMPGGVCCASPRGTWDTEGQGGRKPAQLDRVDDWVAWAERLRAVLEASRELQAGRDITPGVAETAFGWFQVGRSIYIPRLVMPRRRPYVMEIGERWAPHPVPFDRPTPAASNRFTSRPEDGVLVPTAVRRYLTDDEAAGESDGLDVHWEESAWLPMSAIERTGAVRVLLDTLLLAAGIRRRVSMPRGVLALTDSLNVHAPFLSTVILQVIHECCSVRTAAYCADCHKPFAASNIKARRCEKCISEGRNARARRNMQARRDRLRQQGLTSRSTRPIRS